MRQRRGQGMREKAIALAETIRQAGPDGISEGRLAWVHKLAFSSVRCNYRNYIAGNLGGVFPDITYAAGVYRSDVKVELAWVAEQLRADATAKQLAGQEKP